MAAWAVGAWAVGAWATNSWEGMGPVDDGSPTSISISRNWCLEAGGLNAVLGGLTANDPDVGDSHTFTLAAGAGDTNNASFNINGSQLRCNDPATLTAGTYSVFIEADDGISTPYGRAFTVYVYVLAPSVDGTPVASPLAQPMAINLAEEFRV